jgi:hypothetical protein
MLRCRSIASPLNLFEQPARGFFSSQLGAAKEIPMVPCVRSARDNVLIKLASAYELSCALSSKVFLSSLHSKFHENCYGFGDVNPQQDDLL